MQILFNIFHLSLENNGKMYPSGLIFSSLAVTLLCSFHYEKNKRLATCILLYWYERKIKERAY